MFIIPRDDQRPWSPLAGYHCVYEAYIQDDTKPWFPIPRLIKSYAFRRDVAISQFLNGSFRIAVTLIVMAAEIDISLNVRAFEELTFVKPVKEGLYSVKMLPNYYILVGHPNKTPNWHCFYFYIKADESTLEELPSENFRFLWNFQIGRSLCDFNCFLLSRC